ncbi:FAD-binding oxidoreductase [Aspergillus stella-maris]|uniref:FAD-binding oxidoreductase n=1 Tax=Aspergillus stella-maris TaxID=1810926 RepID=UPI003CCD695C
MAGDNLSRGLGACCAALSSVLGDKISFPNSEPYNASLNSYFSLQNTDLKPLCIVSPASAEDVSTALTSIVSTSSTLPPEQQSECHIAIRSGGHASHGGASNIDHGVTFDLSGLNSIHLSDDQSTVSVGVGAEWGDVYAFLEPHGLCVSGGRAAQVGVGGLTLGGGISYFSPRYGWTCDTATSFEIALADGGIINANEHENSDLLVSLRGGGGSNFGIVTKIDLKTFKQGPIWAGIAYYSLESIDAQIKAFEEFSSAEGYDEHASLITSFGFAPPMGSAVVNSIVYTKDEENPKAYQPFLEIPSLMSNITTRSNLEMSKVQGSFQVDGKREMSVVITHEPTFHMLKAAYHRWNSSLAAVENVTGVSWSLSLEPLPPAIYARAPTKNAFGLADRKKALVVTLLSATWEDAKDDALIEKNARELFRGIEEDARRLGSFDPYIYPNYAAVWQDVIASFGEDSVEKLQRVSREVDPKEVFRVNVPGGFKIPS